MTYTELIINGICTGIGTGIGSYIATRYAITHIKELEERAKQNIKLSEAIRKLDQKDL